MANFPNDSPVHTFRLESLHSAKNTFLTPPTISPEVFYHYTTREGLEGIIKSGGLRAFHRSKMNDEGEFDYSRNLVIRELEKIESSKDNRITRSIAKYTKLNLRKLFSESISDSSSFCACLTSLDDCSSQWKEYGSKGCGFALGFDLKRVLMGRFFNTLSQGYFYYAAPVIYSKLTQLSIVPSLINCGFKDLIRFYETVSSEREALTQLRERITGDVVSILYSLADFIKHPDFSHENEFRIMVDANDGSLRPPNYDPQEFVFFDFRNPNTNCIPLRSITVGPEVSSQDIQAWVKKVLSECGYSDAGTIPNILKSRIKPGSNKAGYDNSVTAPPSLRAYP